MDPQIRWLRRHVLARVAERVAVEAVLAATVVAAAATLGGARPGEILMLALTAPVTLALLRCGLAMATSPVNHRYLLGWDDPTADLVEVPVRLDDGADRTPFGPRGLHPLARLEPTDLQSGSVGDGDGDGSQAGDDESVRPTGVDLYQADRGRLAVAVGDDVVTVVSRLADGRCLVTSTEFVPPSDRLVVTRSAEPGTGELGDRLDRLVVEHVGRLLALRAEGIEGVETGVDAVLDGLRAEWEAWQEIGPFIGPLIRLDHRSWPGLALQVSVPTAPRGSGSKDPRYGNGWSDPSVPVVRASEFALPRRQ